MTIKAHKKLKETLVSIKSPDTGYKKSVLLKTYQLPNGLVETFFIDDDKDSVQVFALTEDEHVLLVKQFRAGPEEVELELPGGGMEKGEDALEAGIRELLEETGYKGNKASYLGSMPYSPYSTGRRHGVVILGCQKQGSVDLDPNEFLEPVLIPLELFRDKMKLGIVRGFDLAYRALDTLGKL